MLVGVTLLQHFGGDLVTSMRWKLCIFGDLTISLPTILSHIGTWHLVWERLWQCCWRSIVKSLPARTEINKSWNVHMMEELEQRSYWTSSVHINRDASYRQICREICFPEYLENDATYAKFKNTKANIAHLRSICVYIWSKI